MNTHRSTAIIDAEQRVVAEAIYWYASGSATELRAALQALLKLRCDRPTEPAIPEPPK